MAGDAFVEAESRQYAVAAHDRDLASGALFLSGQTGRRIRYRGEFGNGWGRARNHLTP